MKKNRESMIQKKSNFKILSIKKVIVSIMVFGIAPAVSHAEEKSMFDGLTLGLGVNYSDEGYVEYDSEFLPMPLISYESKYVSIDGTSIAGNIVNNKKHLLSAIVSYDEMSFDPDNARGVYKYLGERKGSILAGGAYTFTWSEMIPISIEVQTDIANRHNGTKAEAAISAPVSVGKILVIPTTGVEWRSDKYNQYYYGVSSAEAAKTGLAAYHPEQSIQPFIDVACIYSFTENWAIMANLLTKYNVDEIYDSPMVDKEFAYSSALILSYAF